jgi:isoquinoline 1-oxidoreductase alpha subunit
MSAIDGLKAHGRHGGRWRGGVAVKEEDAMIRLKVNGRTQDVDADPGMPLLWVLRDILNLTGTKYGCGIGTCGSCTVHLDGVAARACTVPVGSVGAREVTTIEGLVADPHHPLVQAWIALDVPQCGYCQPGMLMAAAALLASKPRPTDAELDAALTNICRCGTYNRVRQAIRLAAGSGATPGPGP